MNRCEDFLRVESNDGFRNWLQRKIDDDIHSWNEGSYEDFLVKQAELLTLVNGCEKEIFNDPRVFYVGKPHLQGVTGTMSTILTNGYLFLYNELLNLNPTIQVNADIDLQILLRLAIHSKENMPQQEREYLQLIVQKLLPKRRTNIVSPEWFQEYAQVVNEIKSKYAKLLYIPSQQVTIADVASFLQSERDEIDFSPENFSMGPKQKTYYVNLNETLKQQGTSVNQLFKEGKRIVYSWVSKGFVPDTEEDIFRLWELHPPYVQSGPKYNDTGNMYMDSLDTFLSTDLPFLQQLFII
jgi:hypothetical protein